MTDTGQNITVPDAMSVQEMIDLEADTQARFSFKIDPSGLFAVCYWVNYVTPRVKDGNGSYKLQAHNYKKVVIS